MVKQVSFITGAGSLNEQDLRNNLKFFKVPEVSFESIRTKLVMEIFDEYSTVLRCMYSTRCNGCTGRSEDFSRSPFDIWLCHPPPH